MYRIHCNKNGIIKLIIFYISGMLSEESGYFCAKPTYPLELFVGSVVGISALTFITGCSLGLLIGLIIMNSKQTVPQAPNINPSTQEEEETAPVTGPVYEEVQLRDLTGEINLSQNVAYDNSYN